MTEDENEELIEEWSQEQLRKRSQELQLVDENGKCIVPLLDNRRAPDTVDRNRLAADDGLVGEFDDGSKSASTTSDSQVCYWCFWLHRVKFVSIYRKKVQNFICWKEMGKSSENVGQKVEKQKIFRNSSKKQISKQMIF